MAEMNGITHAKNLLRVIYDRTLLCFGTNNDTGETRRMDRGKSQRNDRAAIQRMEGHASETAVNNRGTAQELREPGLEAVNIVSRQDVPPDGGYGWMCVACVFLINANTWGVNSVKGACHGGLEAHANLDRLGLFSFRITSKILPSQAQLNLNSP